MLGGLAGVETRGAILIVMSAPTLAFMVLYFAFPWADHWGLRSLSLAAAVFLAMVMGGFSAWGFWVYVLEHRGETVTATVVDQLMGSKNDYYTLEHGGEILPGRMTTWTDPTERGGFVGATVTVVMDPKGVVRPRLPRELEEGADVWMVPLVMSPLLAGLCVLAAWGQTQERVKPTRAEAFRAAGEAYAARLGFQRKGG